MTENKKKSQIAIFNRLVMRASTKLKQIVYILNQRKNVFIYF